MRTKTRASICTRSGRTVDPFDPDPDSIVIDDIAHALSLRNRFHGHTKHFYSTAQHCCLAAEWVLIQDNDDLEGAGWALMHDALDAYLPDVATPLKSSLCVIVGEEDGSDSMQPWKMVEDRLARIIGERWGLSWPPPPIVKQADEAMLDREIHDLMPSWAGWQDRSTPLNDVPEIELWAPAKASRCWIQSFSILFEDAG